ncbi:MAG: 3-isopropylmalate dehydratase small subunit [Gammaproteobacteria bacterium]|nr:3-isopropylmalate dehydratase small subunit [Gammaproteobacteria bacterium]RPG25128.1 MAG: 3-isopropylmalate dehydratase small subunit [Gammaproteobacteria bacterium TMED50]|tara:strand:- start:4187 stop:4783 length:597 start_codon:yes stop_codon:yes gene_type:complete
MNRVSTVSGRGVHVAGNDIDTDRIIPARFLKCVTFDELGPSLFYDERFDGEGNARKHVLDEPRHKGAKVLIADNNFGCGSSREHAPQAIQKFGFKAIIAGSYAEIFHGNSTTLGIPCVVMSDEDRARLAAFIDGDPMVEVLIDIESMKVTCANNSLDITMKPSTREAFLQGAYDPLDALLQRSNDVLSTAQRLGYQAG